MVDFGGISSPTQKELYLPGIEGRRSEFIPDQRCNDENDNVRLMEAPVKDETLVFDGGWGHNSLTLPGSRDSWKKSTPIFSDYGYTEYEHRDGGSVLVRRADVAWEENGARIVEREEKPQDGTFWDDL